MKHAMIPTVFAALMVLATPALAAQCFADYKAKQDNPLRLHYGVIELQGDCSEPAAEREVKSRLAQGGWTLLNVISVFGPDGLSERRDNAGAFFLRF
jgi:hypothetical protein